MGFLTNKKIQIGCEFIVYIDIGATGVLESTFLTNLPQSNETPVKCSYTSPLIRCVNVGSLSYT